MSRRLEGRVAVVTGAGRGIGRSEAIALAREGAYVVVNDLADSEDPAASVVAEIVAEGGRASVNHDDISGFDGAGRLVRQAIEEFGGLDIVVNNAGILRDRMFVNMTRADWDDVMRVHLGGTFGVSQHAAAYWRAESKTRSIEARIVNTSSSSGLYGNIGQANYAAAKAGIAAFTVVTAMELRRYGVTVNALAPAALTRMTEALRERTEEEKQRMNPDNIAPLVVWLASPQSRSVTGRVFNIKGGTISVAETWVAGPEASVPGRWTLAELDEAIPDLVAKARPNSDMNGHPRAEEG
jgi:NAD(P)-dependent dehydrogenase (short-subunit alcohol dehydrogenase family)